MEPSRHLVASGRPLKVQVPLANAKGDDGHFRLAVAPRLEVAETSPLAGLGGEESVEARAQRCNREACLGQAMQLC
jgi:hypothetical protein